MHPARRPVLLGLATAGLASFGRPARAQPSELVVSQFAETRDLAAIDPFRSLDFTIPNSLVFDRLMNRDAEGSLVPGLATAWTRLAPDVWRLTIREGVRFHDGSPLTAADVAATLSYALDPANRSGLRAQLQPLLRAEADGAGAVLLHTAGPSALLPEIIAAAPILPAAQLTDPAAPFRTQPIGSGPWRLAEWRQGERLVFVATGQHWRLPAPGYPRVTVRAVPEASTRVADLLSGGAGIAADIPPALAARVARGGTRLLAQPGARTNYLSFLFRPPFDDARVRQAVHHAIDRQAYVDTLWGGDLAEPATGAVSRRIGGYVPAFPLGDYDPARARALLQQAGLRLPVSVEFDAPPTELVAAQVLQAQLNAAGFDVRINPVESPAAMLDPQRLARSERGRMWMITALDNHAQDAIRPYSAFYSGANFLNAAVGYDTDPRLPPLLAAYAAAEPAERRLAASEALMAVARESMPVVFLAYPRAMYGLAAGVEMPPTTLGHLDFAALRPR